MGGQRRGRDRKSATLSQTEKRNERAQEAAEKRVLFGRSKADREMSAAQSGLEGRKLSAHHIARRDDEDDPK
jgi:hypothetical protein